MLVPILLANDICNPVLVAREAATIDVISGGRFELGLGAGRPGAAHDNQMLGMPFDSGTVRVERLAESLSIITRLLGGETVDVSSAYYTLADAQAFPKPVQPRVPLLIAASGPRLLTLAAREADCVALAIPPTAESSIWAEKIALLKQHAGQRFAQLELNLNLVAVGEDVPNWLRTRLGIDAAQLARSGSPAVVMGTTEQMCEQLLARREALGISYITLSDAFMETCAPVVERLRGS